MSCLLFTVLYAISLNLVMLSGFIQVDILVHFGWMKYGVLLEIVTCLNVVIMVGETLTVLVLKMLMLPAMGEVCYTQVHNLLSIQDFI